MSEAVNFGPIINLTGGQLAGQSLPAAVTQLPEVAGLGEQATEMRTLTVEGASQFSEVLTRRLAGMNNIMVASASQSLDAMEGASLTTDLLAEALRADPDALTAVSDYRGPLNTMAHSARLMHTHQTGHTLREATFRYGDATSEHALALLEAVKAKIDDRRWDGTRSGKVDATTAHARKSVALNAARGLCLIAEQRGRAFASPETVAKVTAYLEKNRV